MMADLNDLERHNSPYLLVFLELRILAINLAISRQKLLTIKIVFKV